MWISVRPRPLLGYRCSASSDLPRLLEVARHRGGGEANEPGGAPRDAGRTASRAGEAGPRRDSDLVDEAAGAPCLERAACCWPSWSRPRIGSARPAWEPKYEFARTHTYPTCQKRSLKFPQLSSAGTELADRARQTAAPTITERRITFLIGSPFAHGFVVIRLRGSRSAGSRAGRRRSTWRCWRRTGRSRGR